MFTANLAGSASSHLRPYDTKRDSHSSHSRLNLHEIDQIALDEDAKRRLYGNHAGMHNTSETNCERLEVDPERMKAILNEKKREQFMRDYKTWGYLACVALIVIAAIILIILAATGKIRNF